MDNEWSIDPPLTGCFGLVLSTQHQNLLSFESDSDILQIGTLNPVLYVMSYYCEDNMIFPRTDQMGIRVKSLLSFIRST